MREQARRVARVRQDAVVPEPVETGGRGERRGEETDRPLMNRPLMNRRRGYRRRMVHGRVAANAAARRRMVRERVAATPRLRTDRTSASRSRVASAEEYPRDAAAASPRSAECPRGTPRRCRDPSVEYPRGRDRRSPQVQGRRAPPRGAPRRGPRRGRRLRHDPRPQARAAVLRHVVRAPSRLLFGPSRRRRQYATAAAKMIDDGVWLAEAGSRPRRGDSPRPGPGQAAPRG